MSIRCTTWASILSAVCCAPNLCPAQPIDQPAATRALHKAVAFYRTHIGYQGAYLWRYSADLKLQEGEGKATRTSGWTQPPGTPSVGEAYLQAWRLSGDPLCLEAATEAAHALVSAQLKSGGWNYHFDLAQPGRGRYAYRVDGARAGKRNHTTFDDNKSQSALMLLMHVDEALGFQDAAIHEAVQYALKTMLAAQYPNGAWPQQYDAPPDPQKYPVKKASYPASWSRTYPKRDYRGYYTLNDNNMSHIIDMLFEAHRILKREDCFRAAEKTGDFFRLAQMPEPQPGWAQQYDLNMHPAWARKFEPAAITGGESQSVMRTLLTLYRFTGHKKFLEPLPRALAYYRKSQLPDGRLARFYELRVNRPLYFTKDYQLTYSDADMPTHYGFQVGSKLESIERTYQKLAAADPETLQPVHRETRPLKMSEALANKAQKIVEAMDDRGAWVEPGTLRYHPDVKHVTHVIHMQTLINNLTDLAGFVGAANRETP